MGGYDAQTIAGVVSTSTHGSGLRFGPFPDAVRVARPGRGRRRAGARRARERDHRLRPSPTASAATARSSRTTTRSTGRSAAWAAWGSWTRSCSRSARVLAPRAARDEHLGGGARGPGRRRARQARPLRAVPQPVRPQGRPARAARDHADRGAEARGALVGRRRAPSAHRDRVLAPAGVGRAAAPRALRAVAHAHAVRRARCGACATRTTRRSPTGCSTSGRPTTCPRSRWSSACRWRATATCARSTGSSRSRTSRPGSASSSTPRRSRCASWRPRARTPR